MSARHLLDLAATEAGHQEAIVELARIHGWLWHHHYDSRRSTPGWPDLTLVRGDTIVFAELKTEKGKLTAAQMMWLDALRNATRHEVHLWRPSDWGQVVHTLTGKAER